MTLLSWLPAATLYDLGWTLLHFLWQGLLLAALLEVVLALLKGARARHNAAFAVLLMMAVAPVMTFLVLQGQGSAFAGAGAATTMPGLVAGGVTYNFTPAAPALDWPAWLVLLWFAGMVALSLRAAAGWWLAESLRRRETMALPADLLARCRELARRLAVSCPVRFLQSAKVDVPVMIGWFRPVILLPISAIAGLPPQQLDALVMHELAHIRRHDAFINIVLLGCETVLFYHPAVWWVGRRIRIERENCCDDLAVAHCGDAVLYVEAMTSLAGRELSGGMALAADGGSLKDRAARLLGVPSDGRRYGVPALAGLVLAGLVAGGIVMAQPGDAATGTTDIAMTVDGGSAPPLTIQAANVRRPIGNSNGIFDYRASRRGDDVVVTQGDTTIRAARVRAETEPSTNPNFPGKLRRLVADGNVEVTTKAGTRRTSHLEIEVKGDALQWAVQFPPPPPPPPAPPLPPPPPAAGAAPPPPPAPWEKRAEVLPPNLDLGLVVTDDKGKAPHLHIRADRISTPPGEFPTVFEGSVVASQGDVTLRADAIRAELAPSTTPGAPGNMTRLIADGNVELTTSKGVLRGNHLEIPVADSGLQVEGASLTATPLPATVPTFTQRALPETLNLVRLFVPRSAQPAFNQSMQTAIKSAGADGFCTMLETVAQDPAMKGSIFTRLRDYRIAGLPEDVQRGLANNPPGGFSKMVPAAAGSDFFARCESR